MALLIGREKLDAIRRRQRKTLAQIAAESGLKIGAVWRVLHGRSYDIRKVAGVCAALGIPLEQLQITDGGDAGGEVT